MNYLCQSVNIDLVTTEIDEIKSDFSLSRQVRFSKFDLLRDFSNLRTLLPKNFTIKNMPKEGIFKIKYSGKSYIRGAANTRYENWTHCKCDEEMTVGVWS